MSISLPYIGSEELTYHFEIERLKNFSSEILQIEIATCIFPVYKL